MLAWSLFAAAYATDPGVRSSIVDQLWGRISSNSTDTGIFSTAYSLGQNGAAIQNIGSVQNVTINVPSSSSSSPGGTPSMSPASDAKKSSHAGAIAGGLVGGIGGAALVGAVGYFWWRKQHRRLEGFFEAGTIGLMVPPVPYADRRPPDTTPMAEAPLGPFELISAKALEAISDPSNELQTDASGSSLSPSSGAASRHGPFALEASATSSSVVSTDTPVTHTDVQGLRSEIQDLRRAMQTLHETSYEPPPGYEPGLEA
ncbi:hypothetical protein EIP86_005884 [Pleurotus ostreatoroseus]|nr:hypothetical protein EIP86_005884 [Pleurotus ostreatoroseus]